jgi:uncharacterized membrane protein YuzA (DUF378 family)
MGVALILFGGYSFTVDTSIFWFFIGFGAVCILGALFNYTTSKRFENQ